VMHSARQNETAAIAPMTFIWSPLPSPRSPKTHYLIIWFDPPRCARLAALRAGGLGYFPLACAR
jgi:hypothetical protein